MGRTIYYEGRAIAYELDYVAKEGYFSYPVNVNRIRSLQELVDEMERKMIEQSDTVLEQCSLDTEVK